MASLLERLNLEPTTDLSPEPGEGEEPSAATLDSIHKVVQQTILDRHLDTLRDARRGGHGRLVLERLIERILVERGATCRGLSRRALVQAVTSRLLGYGPLDRFLQDDSVSEVMVNGCQPIYIEVNGRILKTTAAFQDEVALIEVIRRLVGGSGRRVDASSPYVDARLPDGSRLNAVLPPLAVDGPVLTIRRFPNTPLTATRLIELNSLSSGVYRFLQSCIRARLNCLVSGGTATGKTTLLNILTGCIDDPAERIITIEDAAELKLDHEHRVALETRPPNVEGRGEVTLQDLLRNALRMRPDRLVIGEVRGAEAYDLIQALNTGHDGSLATVHANSPTDALDRLESMALMSARLPASLVRRQLEAALQLLIHLHRLPDGTRMVQEVSLLRPAGHRDHRDLLLPVFRHVVSDGESRFVPQLERLPPWAAAWWRRVGLVVPEPCRPAPLEDIV